MIYCYEFKCDLCLLWGMCTKSDPVGSITTLLLFALQFVSRLGSMYFLMRCQKRHYLNFTCSHRLPFEALPR